MKLRQGRKPPTAGYWLSADRRWSFINHDNFSGHGAWQIGVHRRADEKSWTAEHEARRQWLASIGLKNCDFPTRGAAVAALELALAGASA